MSLEIERIASVTDDVRRLIAELDLALSRTYRPEQRHALSLEQLFGADVRFFVARAGAGLLGCGGVALCDGFAEVKRMYTRPEARRQGVATALLRRLELEAAGAGHSLLRLETGRYQAEAVAFYEREGFERCDAFGAYADMAPTAIATSLFFEKSI
jgi:putative acetyltransferase